MSVAQKSLFEAPLERPELVPGILLARNWHSGAAPVWSRGLRADLTVAARCFPEPVPLRVRLSVHAAAPARPRRLRVESPGHPPVEIAVATDAPVTLLIHSPVHAPGAGDTPIAFELDSIDSPFRIGRSADERLLGLHILSLEPEAPELGFPLEFTDAATCRAVLREGWAQPEPDAGAWSLGERARLVLPGHLRRDREMRIVLHATTLPRPENTEPLRIEIACDGQELAPWHPVTEGDGRLDCPVPAAHPHTDCEIAFRIHGAAAPRALGINADARPLGLLLRRIDLQD